MGDVMAYPKTPGFVRNSDTSKLAADGIEISAPSMRAMIHEYLKGVSGGATCDEIELRFALRHQTASARIRELAMAGMIRDTGARRDTRSGRSARVYVAETNPIDVVPPLFAVTNGAAP